MIKSVTSLLLAVSLLMTTTTAFADSNSEKREKIQAIRQEVLTDLFASRPQAKAEIDESEGYAVFSNVGVQILLLGAGGGRGVVRDTKSGIDTYMKMGTIAIGLGLGVKDFRAVFIFHDRDALTNFVEHGWDFTGEADAAAVAEDKGGEIGEAASVRKKVSVYQFTENGLALQASLHGTKYWQDKKLNRE
ncbi:lipid-binding SYLF domain-containing protein [Kordiimonas pumila]|uniref:YSC84-related protein n=1 Tax=Kordiimonas pumila TaxID=2161677 RepID=A0ABV7D9Y7_9PROT|nr:YSC84-related protein [Kordiimonas pumila]